MVINYLREYGPDSLNEITWYVATQELEKEREEITSEERKRVYVRLYQTHLPTLDSGHVIEFGSKTGDVEPGDRFDKAVEYLEMLEHLNPDLDRDEVSQFLDL